MWFLVVALAVLGLVHGYLYRRLAHDLTTDRRVRRRAAAGTTVLALLVPVTLAGGRILPWPAEQALAWVGYLWLGLMFYLLVALLALELPRLVALLAMEPPRVAALRAVRRVAGRPARSPVAVAVTPGRVGEGPGHPAGGRHTGTPGERHPHTGTPGERHPHAGTPGERHPHAGTPGDGHRRGGSRGAGREGDADPAGAGTPAGGADPGRRLFLARSVAVAAGLIAAGTVGAGAVSALGPPRLRRVDVPVPRLRRELDGLRVALMSDIHLGPILGRGHTERVVAAVNGLDADLVAVVGDLVDGTVDELGAAAEPLRRLRSRRGAFFVTGNHEYFSGYRQWVSEVAALGLRPLRNERLDVGGLTLAGVNDATGAMFGDAADYARALDGRDPALPTVLLAHQPVQVREAARRGVEVQLSGHTHGGQMWPFHYVVRAQQGALAGLSRSGPTRLFVTRGAGFWGPPVRVGAPPEVVLVRLRTADTHAG